MQERALQWQQYGHEYSWLHCLHLLLTLMGQSLTGLVLTCLDHLKPQQFMQSRTQLDLFLSSIHWASFSMLFGEAWWHNAKHLRTRYSLHSVSLLVGSSGKGLKIGTIKSSGLEQSWTSSYFVVLVQNFFGLCKIRKGEHHFICPASILGEVVSFPYSGSRPWRSSCWVG